MISNTLPLMVARFCRKKTEPVARQLQRRRRGQQGGAEQDQSRQAERDIERPLQEALHQRHFRAVDVQEGRVVQHGAFSRGDDDVLQLGHEVHALVVLVAEGLQRAFFRVGHPGQKDGVMLQNGFQHVRALIMNDFIQAVALGERFQLGRHVIRQFLRRCNNQAAAGWVNAKIAEIRQRDDDIEQENLQCEGAHQQVEVLAPEGQRGVGLGVLRINVHNLQEKVRNG